MAFLLILQYFFPSFKAALIDFFLPEQFADRFYLNIQTENLNCTGKKCGFKPESFLKDIFFSIKLIKNGKVYEISPRYFALGARFFLIL